MARRADPELREWWQELMDEWSASSLTVAEFCRLQEVSTASFYYWRRKLQAFQDERLDADPSGAFLPVQVTNATSGESRVPRTQVETTADGDGKVRVSLPSGVQVELPASDRLLVQSVITALVEADGRQANSYQRPVAGQESAEALS